VSAADLVERWATRRRREEAHPMVVTATAEGFSRSRSASCAAGRAAMGAIPHPLAEVAVAR